MLCHHLHLQFVDLARPDLPGLILRQCRPSAADDGRFLARAPDVSSGFVHSLFRRHALWFCVVCFRNFCISFLGSFFVTCCQARPLSQETRGLVFTRYCLPFEVEFQLSRSPRIFPGEYRLTAGRTIVNGSDARQTRPHAEMYLQCLTLRWQAKINTAWQHFLVVRKTTRKGIVTVGNLSQRFNFFWDVERKVLDHVRC